MMNSNMLKKQKDDFLKSVDDYNVKYKKIMEKIKQINVSFDNSSDTLLYKFMGENNIKIIEKINNLLKELETAKQASIQEVDVKIFQLEEQERLERERMAESLSSEENN